MTMPATDFNVPRGSFPTPITPIGVGPLEGPLVEVRFNYKWCQVIVGSLSQLLLDTTWDVATQAELTAIQENVFDLMASFCVNPPPAGVIPNTGTDVGDDYMLRQDPDNPCLLQTSVDGVNWCTWADLSKCTPAPAQPGPGSPQPAPGGGCQTYHAILPANGKWLMPTFVNSGDTITVSNVKGVWTGGTTNWYCPDGTPFVGFFCIGIGSTVPADPLNTVDHMRLIFGLSGGGFVDAMAGPVTIAGGVVANTVEFQANDSVLDDNAGQIEFDIEVCNNQAAEWSHTFDFKTADGSWFLRPDGSLFHGTWTPGVGWASTDTTSGTNHEREVYIERDFSATVTRVQVFVDWTPGASFPSGDQAYQLLDQSSAITTLTHSAMPGTGTNVLLDTGPISRAMTRLVIDLTADFEPSATPLDGTAVVTKVIVNGTGTDPF